MSYLVLWSNKALNDLQRVYDFLSEKNEDAAIEAFKTIRQAAIFLENFPGAGRPATDLDPEHREIVVPFGVSGYVFVYEVNENQEILILALKHQKEADY